MKPVAGCVLDAESEAFPRDLLAECSSALLLFCSGRMGAADGHWVRAAGLLDVACVDWDAATLDPFQAAYPSGWAYLHADAFKYLETPRLRSWDLISADMPSQLADRLPQLLAGACASANKYVVATLANVGPGAVKLPDPPDGWRYRCDPIYRTEYIAVDDEISGGPTRRFWWLVLERAT